MVANILPADTLDPGDEVDRFKFNCFLEYGHLVYQFKQNYECSNMVANKLPVDPPTLGIGSVGQKSFFQNMVMLHIQLKRFTNAAT